MKKYVVIDTNVLVTGNGKHFPEKYFIATPAKLMDILEKN